MSSFLLKKIKPFTGLIQKKQNLLCMVCSVHGLILFLSVTRFMELNSRIRENYIGGALKAEYPIPVESSNERSNLCL